MQDNKGMDLIRARTGLQRKLGMDRVKEDFLYKVKEDMDRKFKEGMDPFRQDPCQQFKGGMDFSLLPIPTDVLRMSLKPPLPTLALTPILLLLLLLLLHFHSLPLLLSIRRL